MGNVSLFENGILRNLGKHSCVAVPIPNGYRVEYHGASNLEWQEVLLWMSSLDGYSTSVVNSSSAFLFRL